MLAAPAPFPAPPRAVRWTAPAPGTPWVDPPAGLGDLAELEPTWAHAAHRTAVAVLSGAVGDAHTWTRWGYPPPAAYRGPVAPPVPHPGPAPTAATAAPAFHRGPAPAVHRPAPTTPAFPAAVLPAAALAAGPRPARGHGLTIRRDRGTSPTLRRCPV